MSIPKKGTPEYETWKNSPAYEEWRNLVRSKWQDPEYKKAHSANHFKKGQVAHNKGVPMSEDQLIKMRALRPSEEAIAKMRATKTGQTLSDEHKKKIGESLKGRECSPKTRAKIANANTGRKHTPESIEKMSVSKRGKPSGRKGTTHSQETRAKLSTIGKNRVHPRGYKHTEEFSKKRSEINRKQWAEKTEDERRAHLDKLHEGARDITDSWIENAYAQRLDAQGIVYERQKRIGWYRVDFYIEAENKVIEIQGCYWHACEVCERKGQINLIENHEQKRLKDTHRHAYLIRKGYTVEIVWEHDLPPKPYKKPSR